MCGRKPCDKPDCTWSERHRVECEARWVMRLPKSKRVEYYTKVKEHRGEKAAMKLLDEVNRQWRLRRSS
jgi:hypothetical protein